MDTLDSQQKKDQEELEKTPFNVCIEIGSSRVKVGVQNTKTQQFNFFSEETKFFFYPLDSLFDKLSAFLHQKGVYLIQKIGISTTGEVDSEKGTIKQCGTLKIKSKQKHFQDFELVTLINSKLEQNILQKDFTYLINDGHSAGLGIYYYAKEKYDFPFVSLSLGTYPAVSVITSDFIATVESRKNFINGKHISAYCAKSLVEKDKKTDQEYTQNILDIIPLLSKISLNMTGENMTHLFILGGMSNHISDDLFFKDEAIKNMTTIIKDDQIIYNQIIFPALLKYHPKLSADVQLIFKEDFSVSIN
ncbi:hypothetical protein ABPG74_012798 [Tetrahymena malaccensis]